MTNTKTHLLVVEDEELIRTMIKINLEKAGYRVTALADAESMLEMLADKSFSLVLLDIMLSGMSGEEALLKLREQKLEIPVIMVTARTDTGSKVKTFDLGADDYIAKPFEMVELLARVKAILRRKKY